MNNKQPQKPQSVRFPFNYFKPTQTKSAFHLIAYKSGNTEMKQLMKLKNFTGNIIKKTLIYLARSLQNLNIPNDFILLLSPARLLSLALPKIYGVCHFEDQCLDYQLYMYFVPKVQGFYRSRM